MKRQDRSPVVTLMLLVVLASVAWLGGGAVRVGLLALGNTPGFASGVGAMSATALFVLLVVGYFVYESLPERDRPGRLD
ncbi:hypothetical protein DP107_02285 [Haloglomus irregulare]|jgi:hypothetical protein|uniref:Uncharacterized protein n=1 Tax=Haloglomus irregulare TaxID=2234134 RepID=A0A554NGA7_9EURY|nr:hypothetical protein [Haloglomus irregulare]TSD16030.1 hypothetical protein DP107_02285 [Haloglomus irregulare]